MGTHQKRLDEKLLKSTYSIYFVQNEKKKYQYILVEKRTLSRAELCFAWQIAYIGFDVAWTKLHIRSLSQKS